MNGLGPGIAVGGACAGAGALVWSFSLAWVGQWSTIGLPGAFPTFSIERKACAARKRSVLDLLSVGTDPFAYGM